MLDHTKLSLKDIHIAQKRIKPYVRKTPLINSSELGNRTGGNVFLKLENMHETGAFKIRGATNKLLSLSEAEKEKGVTTFSTGNHGLAVAYMAGRLGIRAVICISNRVPDAKVNRLKRLGAEVLKVGDNQDDAEERAYELQKEQGMTVIHPFDDLEVIAGQGTIGLELIEEQPELEAVVIPVSGGGLFAGISYVLKSYNPQIRIIGVSMEKSAVMYESIKANQIIKMQEEDTLADSLLGGIGDENQYTYQMVKEYIDDFILLTEDEIASGMAFMLDEHQLAVEGAAATSAAVMVHKQLHLENKTAAGIITGRNVDTAVVLNICEKMLPHGGNGV